MVLVTAADVDQHHQRLGTVCGDSCPDMAQSADMDQTTATSLIATTPPPPSSPSSGHRPSADSCEDTGDGQNDGNESPMANGSAFGDCGSQPSRDGSGRTPGFSHYLKAVVKKEEEEEEEFVVAVKEEQELDAPLDFSIKRKESDSEASRDAQPFSISRSPPYPAFSSPSSRHSPDTSLQQQAVARNHHNNNGSRREGQSPSPGHGKFAGAPKQTSKSSANGGTWPSAAAHSSAAALGILAEESGGGVTPAALSAVLGQNGALSGSLGNVPGLLGEAHKLQAASGSKLQRPFKAYPKDVLKMPLGYLGLPGVSPFAGIDPSFAQGLTVLPEDLMAMYKQQTELLKEREKQVKNLGKRSSRSPPPSALSPSSIASPSSNRNHVTHTSPPPSSTPASQSFIPSSDTGSSSPGLSTAPHTTTTSQPYASIPPSPAASQGSNPAPAVLPTSAAPPLVSSTSSVTAAGGNRKRPRNLPDTEKDEAYWERRRKNNDAAKRSRDARRAKEDEIAIRAALLEQENLRLRVEVATLKTETARLRCLLYKT